MSRDCLDELFSDRANICFLVGAGISIDPPSCLPDGSAFSSSLVKKVVPKDEQSDVFTLMDHTRPSASTPGDFLRFEELVELVNRDMDPGLRLLDIYKDATEPNAIHLFLAQMLVRGHNIITTNFDSLIEYALKSIGVSPKAILPVIFRKEWEKNIVRKNVFPVYKLHGSLYNVSRQKDCRETVQTTLARISENKCELFGLELWKTQVLEGLLKDNDLVVFGYSGLDDFDVIPTLWSISSKRRLIWVQHAPEYDADNAIIESVEEFGAPALESTGRLGRILARFTQQSKRDANSVIRIRIKTSSLVDYLWHLFLKDKDKDPLPEPKERLSPDFSHISPTTADKWLLVAQIYDQHHKYSKSSECYSEALRAADIEKSHSICLRSLAGLNHNLSKLGEIETANDGFHELLDYARENGNTTFEAIALNEIATFQMNQNLTSESLDTYNQALHVAEKDPDLTWKARTLNNLALAYMKEQSFDKAKEHLDKAIALNERLGDIRAKSTNLANLALLYSLQGQIDQAIKTYNDLLHLSEQTGDLGKIATAHGQKGLIYKTVGNHHQALSHYNQALDFCHIIEVPDITLGVLLNTVILLNRLRETHEGLQRCEEALQILAQVRRPEMEATFLHLHGNFLQNLKEFDRSEESFQKCIQIYDSIDHPARKSNALSDYAFLLHDMGKRDAALRRVQEALKIASQIGDRHALHHAQQTAQIIHHGL